MPSILGANTLSSGFGVANSCRFDEGSSDNLSADSFGTPTSDKTYTLSWWFKRSKLGEATYQFGWYDGSRTNSGDIVFDSGDTLSFYHGSDDGNGKLLMPNRLFRDPAAWTHVVWAVDTTQGTASNRIKIYFNGVRETSFSTEVYPDQNAVSKIFHDSNNRIAAQWNAAGTTFNNGYMAEIVFIDGQQLTPTSFGEFDEDSPNIWKPIDVSDLTFGNNGFHLDFEDSSALGDDVSGNNNDFTVNNLTAVDQSTDTCTNNFATFNSLTTSLQSGGVVAYTEGNTKIVTAYSNTNYLRYPQAYTTIGVTSGKWYAEFKIGAIGSAAVGIANTGEFGSDGSTNPYAGYAASGAVYTNGGEYRANNGSAGSQGTYTEDDIIGCALDMDNLKIYWHKNGTYINSGDPTSGATGTGARAVLAPTTPGGFYVFTAGADNTGIATIEINTGSPSYAISSGNADGKGFGNFEFAVPSGYLALCTKNLGSDG